MSGRKESERKVRNAFRMESDGTRPDSGARNPGRVGEGAGQGVPRGRDYGDSRAQRIAARQAAELRTIENHDAARMRAERAFPDAPPVWVPILASTVRTLEQRGMKVTRASVLERLKVNGHPINGDEEFDIPPLEGS